MMELAQALAELRRSTRAAVCAECGKCTSVCPLAATGGYHVRSIACQSLEEELEGRGVGIRRCLTCGSCDLRCPQGVQFLDLVRGVRELAEPESIEACPHGGAMQSCMRIMARNGAEQDRLGWLEPDLRTEPEKGDVFFWAGCAGHLDAFFPELSAGGPDANVAAVRVLNRLGVVPVVSARERCCGHDLLWNGDRQGFEALARHNVQLLADSGAHTLVTACAECLRTWRLDYPPFQGGGAPKVLHLSEYLAQRLPELEWKEGPPRRVTFQDPCRLGRHAGVYDAPRQVLAAMPGVELVEMPRSGRRAICCAGGTWTHCDRHTKEIQADRIAEARATGADTLVTACPKCRIHFACAMRDPDVQEAGGIRMMDLSELVAGSLARAAAHTGKEASE
ncbi:MAG: (Fe-S)-binding protein [Candidatus Eisenbacteria bacterium]|nr:(Fe-S)-binding protein [Candidatus Eisenbacteria bacterium]